MLIQDIKSFSDSLIVIEENANWGKPAQFVPNPGPQGLLKKPAFKKAGTGIRERAKSGDEIRGRST